MKFDVTTRNDTMARSTTGLLRHCRSTPRLRIFNDCTALCHFQDRTLEHQRCRLRKSSGCAYRAYCAKLFVVRWVPVPNDIFFKSLASRDMRRSVFTLRRECFFGVVCGLTVLNAAHLNMACLHYLLPFFLAKSSFEPGTTALVPFDDS